jgi:type VI secretion system secreted protein VgrG
VIEAEGGHREVPAEAEARPRAPDLAPPPQAWDDRHEVVAMAQAENRALSVSTPLGPDVFQLTSFTGQEELSRLFRFQLDLAADGDRAIPFEQLVGRPMTVSVSLRGRRPRYFNGICSRFSAGGRSGKLALYRAEVVPQLWLLTRSARSRIYQDATVAEILRRVLGDHGQSADFRLQTNYQARNYCVQYRETDFDFVSRLMEEEGIAYFFDHSENGHTMVLLDTSSNAPLEDAPTVFYDRVNAGSLGQPIVFAWEKTQELRSGRVTLRDHSFEVPSSHLEAQATILPAVQAGAVTHQLALPSNSGLELYDYPGRYAQRFDGVDPGGTPRPDELGKIQPDAIRTTGIRIGHEATQSLEIVGGGIHPAFLSGHRFTLSRHFDGNGDYVLTSVQHAASLPANAGSAQLEYSNSFTCIPSTLPFRPERRTQIPVIAGPQTAVVVGPPGEEIFTDKYGRVKVQFHWDREGRTDQNSSCWIRVSQPFSGQGIISIPRIGQEVIVDFLEGDPDRPLILGRVYNADDVPPRQRPSG